MLKDNLASVRQFMDSDPWLYSVLNASLESLKGRDDQLADAIDAGGGLGGGLVDITGGAIAVINYLPPTWTVTKVSTGVYTIGHPYNTVHYTVMPTVVNPTPLLITPSNVTTNSFKISIFTFSGVPTDARFTCFVSRYG